MPLIRAFSIIALLTLASCSHSPLDREISGEVFIVRGDGQSVKLGRVDVQIYDANELAQQLHFALQSLEQDRAAAKKLKEKSPKWRPK